MSLRLFTWFQLDALFKCLSDGSLSAAFMAYCPIHLELFFSFFCAFSWIAPQFAAVCHCSRDCAREQSGCCPRFFWFSAGSLKVPQLVFLGSLSLSPLSWSSHAAGLMVLIAVSWSLYSQLVFTGLHLFSLVLFSWSSSS
ncbi:unnamed protein product [Ilex paraguariensis]|uniref:Secreted protein n=1 Tax=Ilex paraguariensis TaxID=185542 RepID=A0ABC8TSF2_9AQUA